MNQTFCFTVDDNIRFLKELTEGRYRCAFDHPYLAMYRRLHEKFGICVQLNLFYASGDFTLAQMTDRYRAEFDDNADWLKMSFHSRIENVRPYVDSDYDEVFFDANAVHREILRFAGENVLAKTTTVHFCLTTDEGLRALSDTGVRGLLGLYGTQEKPRLSYQTVEEDARKIREGDVIWSKGMAYSGIDIVLNCYTTEQNLSLLQKCIGHPHINVMIHEQYFYPDYPLYQKDFESKLTAVFTALYEAGYHSTHFEKIIFREERT